MEEIESNPIDDEDVFFDAIDELSFLEFNVSEESSSYSVSESSLFHLDSTEIRAEDSLKEALLPENLPAAVLRRRRHSFKHNRRRSTSADDSVVSFEPTSIKTRSNLKENEKTNENVDSVNVLFRSSRNISFGNENSNEISTVSSSRDLEDSASSNFLVFVAGLMIKAIGFQLSVLINFVTFPIWLSYHSYSFVVDPFGTLGHGREYLMNQLLRVWNLISETISPYLNDWLKDEKSIWKIAFRFGWGLLWSIYACLILISFLVFAFVVSGLMMRFLVEEPIHIKEILNFDYTKNSPVAFVPIVSCPVVSCGKNCREWIEVGKNVGSHVLPPNHKLQVTVSLTLPESEYNQHLGIFQIRVEFLSANGNVLTSSIHPCMLRFKSQPIRYLLTLFKAAPLVAGYLSESQTLNLNFRGFVEGNIRTSCLKVSIEQRAQYRAGAGVPEIYSSSLVLESELPLIKRIIWYWRKTIFIWISMTFFMMELLSTLICCRSLIIPRARPFRQ